jgi:hypothetical protein
MMVRHYGDRAKNRMIALTGTAQLARLNLRRDRM